MRIWFIGTGKFAALCLENLIKFVKIERVITSQPTRSGRGNKENPSQVEQCAIKLNSFTSSRRTGWLTRTGLLSKNDELIQELKNNAPDVIFVIDFGQIIREPFLSTPKFGCLNIHPSLLPKWRGAAPVQRALMSGDRQMGVTVFKLVPEMDAGGILAQKSLDISEDTGAYELYEKLSALGAEIACDGLKKLEAGTAVFTEQDNNLASYASKLERGEFEINLSWPAEKINNTVRALDASGGAFMIFKNKRLKIWRTRIVNLNNNKNPGEFLGLDSIENIENKDTGAVFACADGAICLCEVQPEGKNKMSGAAWARGQRII